VTEVPPAIWAAVIAALAGFLVSMLSKEFKVSEFRQAWIDALRNDLAELVSIHFALNDHVANEVQRASASQSLPQFNLEGRQKDFERLEATSARIRLRLNPVEHRDLICLVKRMGAPTESLRTGDTAQADELGERLLAESQSVLKAEWRRVKRGEVTFYATKWLLAFVVVAALVVLVQTYTKGVSSDSAHSATVPADAAATAGATTRPDSSAR
jgi:hypothetical protein